MSETRERIEITRADYEATFGLKTDPFTIGACLYSAGSVLLREYVFIEPQREIEMLEAMFQAVSTPVTKSVAFANSQ